MNYTEFMNAMLCEIRGQVDAQVRTELYTVTKNNGTRRTGILFKQEDSNLAPTIYLEEFYQKYLKGQQVPDLADSICSIYQEIRVKKTCDCQNLFDFNHVKEHIVYKLIRRDANEELLKQIPYESFLDLAVVYYIQIDNTRFGSAAIQIRNEHLRYWRVEKEEIRRLAEKNTPRIYPVQIRQIVRFPMQTLPTPFIWDTSATNTRFPLSNVSSSLSKEMGRPIKVPSHCFLLHIQ